MMKQYPIYKGVETPLKIWGMRQNYFYLFCLVSAITILLIVFVVLAEIKQGFNLTLLLLEILIPAGFLLGLRIFLITKSGKKRYKERKNIKVITNVDITKLKQ